MTSNLSRRAFLRAAAASATTLALAACGGTATPVTGSPSSGVAAAGAPAKPASSAAKATVRAAWVALTANQMIWPVAIEAGYFDKYGVNFNLQYIQGSGTALPSLLAGELDTAAMGGSATVDGQSQGSDVIMTAGFLNIAVFRVMAQAAIKSIDDVKGKTVAVSKVGNVDYFAWKAIMARQGWKDTDLKFAAANDPPGQVALMQRGDAAAIALSPPNDVLAEKIGAHLVLDTGTWNLPEQSTGMNVTRRWLSQNRATALNVIKASIEGIARWKKDPAFVKEVTKKYLKQDDQRYIDVGYDAYASIWPKAPYPSRDGFVQVIEEVSTQNPKAKSLNPDQLFDSSLVKELEDSGFIKQIYGS